MEGFFNILDLSNKYKFVHIDVDLYQPTYDTLEYIYDKVVVGGSIEFEKLRNHKQAILAHNLDYDNYLPDIDKIDDDK